MKFESLSDLINLHRCLIEAKFNPNPIDHEILFSPIIAAFANQCVDEQEKAQIMQFSKSRTPDDWRQIETHPELIENIINALEQRDLTFIESGRINEALVNACAPFTVKNETLERIRTIAFKR